MKNDMTFGKKEEGKKYCDREGAYLIAVRPVENVEEKMHVQIQAWAVKYYLK